VEGVPVRGTWLLILGEMACWGIYGTCESDPRLMVLGWTGVTASLLVLARTTYSVRRAVAVRELAAQLAGTRAPATAMTRPARARITTSGAE